MRRLDGVTTSVGMSLSKLLGTVKDREAWCAAVPGVTKSQTQLSDSTTAKAHVSLLPYRILCVLVTQSCPTLCDPMDWSPLSMKPSVQAPLSMKFSRQEYWSGLPFPFPGIFPTRGSNLGFLPCRQILYHLSHQGSPFTPILKPKAKGQSQLPQGNS